MKRALVLGLLVGLLGAMLVGTASSDEHPSSPPPHGHLQLLGIEVEGEGKDARPVSIRRCHPLANGRAVPMTAHHANLHTGRAAEAQWQAGNAVVPVLPPYTPWGNCAELMELFLGE